MLIIQIIEGENFDGHTCDRYFEYDSEELTSVFNIYNIPAQIIELIIEYLDETQYY